MPSVRLAASMMFRIRQQPSSSFPRIPHGSDVCTGDFKVSVTGLDGLDADASDAERSALGRSTGGCRLPSIFGLVHPSIRLPPPATRDWPRLKRSSGNTRTRILPCLYTSGESSSLHVPLGRREGVVRRGGGSRCRSARRCPAPGAIRMRQDALGRTSRPRLLTARRGRHHTPDQALLRRHQGGAESRGRPAVRCIGGYGAGCRETARPAVAFRRGRLQRVRGAGPAVTDPGTGCVGEAL